MAGPGKIPLTESGNGKWGSNVMHSQKKKITFMYWSRAFNLSAFARNVSCLVWCRSGVCTCFWRRKQVKYSVLKHKDSFGKSENLSKIFFAEILVFDHDYEGKSSSSNGLLWISFIKKIIIIWIIFRIVRRPSEQIYTRYQLYFARCNYYQIVNLTAVQSVKVVQKFILWIDRAPH